MDRGDYRAAATAFAAAVRADPSFQQAQQQQQAAEAAPAVQASPGDLVTVVEAVVELSSPVEPATAGALQQTTAELSPTIADLTGQTGVSSTLSHPTIESQGVTNIVQTFGLIRIIFKLP
jgi:hypothetical protein